MWHSVSDRRFLASAKCPDWLLVCTKLPVLCVLCVLYLGGGGCWQQECEGDYSGQFSAEVNNEWHFTSAATICLHVLHNYYTGSIQHFSGTTFYFYASIVHLVTGGTCV
jgi:hypothetical protein